MSPDGQTRSLDCDLLVVGGGAAGLSGAVTAAHDGLKVIVAEKAPVLGGATAWSGGFPEGEPVQACLAPSGKAPFYAINVLPGSFGTFAGLKADAHSRVLNAAGEPIPGLYVAGSDQANVMGGHYPSGGIKVGPAMIFGYIAGRHADGVAEDEVVTPVPMNDAN
jgi:succinate dehydrogenase/fumarate reductase flavoprotein subunit